MVWGVLCWVKGGMSHARQHPRLETERLVLRRFTPADVEPLFSLMRDREVNTFLPWFPLETEADAARYLEEHYLDYYRRPSGCRYAICLRGERPPHRLPPCGRRGEP